MSERNNRMLVTQPYTVRVIGRAKWAIWIVISIIKRVARFKIWLTNKNSMIVHDIIIIYPDTLFWYAFIDNGILSYTKRMSLKSFLHKNMIRIIGIIWLMVQCFHKLLVYIKNWLTCCFEIGSMLVYKSLEFSFITHIANVWSKSQRIHETMCMDDVN